MDFEGECNTRTASVFQLKRKGEKILSMLNPHKHPFIIEVANLPFKCPCTPITIDCFLHIKQSRLFTFDL